MVEGTRNRHVHASLDRAIAQVTLQTVLEASPNATLIVDRDGIVRLVNARAAALFGRAPEVLPGLVAADLFAGTTARVVAEAFAHPTARHLGGARDLFVAALDRQLPVEITLSTLTLDEAPYTLASILDLSERVRAEAVHERLAAIVEGSADAIMSTSLDGEIQSWNAGAEVLFGYAADEAIGRNVAMLTPDRCRDQEREIATQVRAGQRANPFTAVHRRKDGSEVEVSVTLSPLRDAAGALLGESKIARDITELNRRGRELERSNAELEQFAYVASHDLQEPLRMVANYTELLAQRYRGQLDERADKYIHYATDGARRMQRLVADLLAYSRVGSQGKPLRAVACGDVVTSVLATLRAQIRDAEATVVVGDLPVVMADEVQLAQLFQNLVSNAIKFRSALAPRVEIAAVREADHWTFSISDNGIGIDPAHTGRLFQMFQRLHGRDAYDGSGIGLAIAKRIVERHGGTISVSPNREVGTTFSFTLPSSTVARINR